MWPGTAILDSTALNHWRAGDTLCKMPIFVSYIMTHFSIFLSGYYKHHTTCSLHRDVKATNEIMSEFHRSFYLSKFKVLFSFMDLRGSPISTHGNYACYCNGKTNISHQARNNTRLLTGVGFPSVGGDFLLRTDGGIRSSCTTTWVKVWIMASCWVGEVGKSKPQGVEDDIFM